MMQPVSIQLLMSVSLTALVHSAVLAECTTDCAVGENGRVYSSNDLRINSQGKLEASDGTKISKRPSGDAWADLQRQKMSEQSAASQGAGSVPLITGGSASLDGSAASGAGGSGGSSPASGNSGSSATTVAEQRRNRSRHQGPSVKLVVGGSGDNGIAKTGRLPIIE